MAIESLPALSKSLLEDLYRRFNSREFVHPDPLEFLYDCEDVRDREIAALVASSLAYGRVVQILRSVSEVLCVMPRPASFLRRSSFESLRRTFSGFKHRFTTGEDLARLLFGARRVVDEYGSLNECFLSGMADGDETVVPALSAFARKLNVAPDERNSLLPCPSEGSACKRLHLFLRWMVRQDAVDPGGWTGVSPGQLVVPLDTHLHRICRSLMLTERKQADIKTALEITVAFRTFAPEDPVRYDFALTRLGIRKDADPTEFLKQCGLQEVA